jgi:chromosome segregation ATPase
VADDAFDAVLAFHPFDWKRELAEVKADFKSHEEQIERLEQDFREFEHELSPAQRSALRARLLDMRARLISTAERIEHLEAKHERLSREGAR